MVIIVVFVQIFDFFFMKSAQHGGVRGSRALGVTAPLSLDGPTDRDEVLTTDLHGKLDFSRISLYDFFFQKLSSHSDHSTRTMVSPIESKS